MSAKYALYFLLPVCMALVSTASAGVTENVLHGFNRFPDGNQPRSAVILDQAGNVYGTTYSGGTNAAGTVFQVTPSESGWTETVLYSFCAEVSCTDGNQPLGALVLDAAGNLYGTTFNGGANNYGEVFELTNSPSGWTLSVLHSFSPDGSSDGANPLGGLTIDTGGNLYGTTQYGGSSNQGIAFKLSPSSSGWTETVVHNFIGGSDGWSPNGDLALDDAGNLYGTTYGGGPNQAGTVFKLEAGTWTETILYSFTGGLDGSGPLAGVTLDANGNLLGSTYYGGAHGLGTAFILSEEAGVWAETVLFNFRRKSGFFPNARLIIDKFGNVYGTTSQFGPHKGGTVYELKPSQDGWTLRVLYGFGGVAKHGVLPNAGLALDSAGNLYGTTEFGGDMHCNSPLGCGTVFQISRISHGRQH